MKKYLTKQQSEQNPSPGEITESPSMTIEGEFMEMKDILNNAMKGMNYPKTDAQYFSTEAASKITSLFRPSLDLTDLDKLREKANYFHSELQKAEHLKKKESEELKEEIEKNQSSGTEEKPEE